MNGAVEKLESGPVTVEQNSAPPADSNFARQRRIRKWLIVTALVAFTAFVYITAMVKMAAVHQLAHFM